MFCAQTFEFPVFLKKELSSDIKIDEANALNLEQPHLYFASNNSLMQFRVTRVHTAAIIK